MSIQELHDQLCHPGITRTNHFVKCRNLPYSLDEIRNLAASCPICAEIKPRFYKPPPAHLIKSTPPFERINILKVQYYLTIETSIYSLLSPNLFSHARMLQLLSLSVYLSYSLFSGCHHMYIQIMGVLLFQMN